MARKPSRPTGSEPVLGGEHAARLSGLEPALSRAFGPPYGRFRVAGCEAPTVPGRRLPLVVLADMDDSTGELVALLAASNGYDVRRSGDGNHALGMVRALEPNLLVVGLRPPALDGLDLVRRLRCDRDRLVQGIPVIVMDVHYGVQSILSAFQSGADDYLEMPYEVPVLLRAWRRAVARLRRPAPLTALLNEDDLVRRAALAHLLASRPDRLEEALGELLWQPIPEVRAAVRWALQRIGTGQALAILEREAQSSWGGDHASG